MYAPGGLYGWDVMYINGMPVPYDYWTAYAIEHCLENYMGLGPQEIRAAADDPTLNCERFNVTSAPAVPRQECNESYSWCAPKGKCIRIWEETCY